MLRPVVGLVTALSLAALVPSSASAMPPLHELFPPLQIPGDIDCGTFHDHYVDFYTGTQTTFFDATGNPTRLVLNIAHTSNDVNSLSLFTIHEHGHFVLTVNLATGVQTITGSQEVANRRGTGVVVQDVGRAVFDADDNLLFFAGGKKHSELFGGDQVLCDALA